MGVVEWDERRACDVTDDQQGGIRWYSCMCMLYLIGYILTLCANKKDHLNVDSRFSKSRC